MGDIVETARRILGLPKHQGPPLTSDNERDAVQQRLARHELRLNRVDAEIDVQRASLRNHIERSKEN